MAILSSMFIRANASQCANHSFTIEHIGNTFILLSLVYVFSEDDACKCVAPINRLPSMTHLVGLVRERTRSLNIAW